MASSEYKEFIGDNEKVTSNQVSNSMNMSSNAAHTGTPSTDISFSVSSTPIGSFNSIGSSNPPLGNTSRKRHKLTSNVWNL